MTEQELKEYSWEICERFEHLQTALGRLEYHEHLNKMCLELIDLKLTEQECCTVLGTFLRDYKLNFEPHLVPAFEDIHCYLGKYLKNQPTDSFGTLKEKLGFGRRPA